MWPRGEVRRNLPLMRYAFGIPGMEGQKKKKGKQTHKHTRTKNSQTRFCNDESVARVLARVSRNGCIDRHAAYSELIREYQHVERGRERKKGE